MNSVRTKCISLKVLRFTTSGCKDIVVRKFEFVAKTQFLFVFKHYFLFNKKIKEKFFLKESKKKENYTYTN